MCINTGEVGDLCTPEFVAMRSVLATKNPVIYSIIVIESVK